MLRSILSLFFVACLVVITGCADVGLSRNAAATKSDTPAAIAPSNKPADTPQDALAALPRLKGKAKVEMKLKYGTVTMELDGDLAPITAGNFIDLTKRGVYNGLTFHRVVKQPSPFVAQGGDPLGDGTGSFIDPTTSQPRYVPLEIAIAGEKSPVYSRTVPPTEKIALRHSRGAVAMARSQAPDSASSQFYIALDNVGFLDGSYAVFGYVTQGMELVDKIEVGDRIESMTVLQGVENLKQPS